MKDEIKEKLDEWYQKNGRLVPVYLQWKLKISYKEAIKLIDEFQNEKNNV